MDTGNHFPIPHPSQAILTTRQPNGDRTCHSYVATPAPVLPTYSQPHLTNQNLMQGQVYLVQNQTPALHASNAIVPRSQKIWAVPVVNQSVVPPRQQYSAVINSPSVVTHSIPAQPPPPHNGQPCVLLSDLIECKTCHGLFRNHEHFSKHMGVCNDHRNSGPTAPPQPSSFALPMSQPSAPPAPEPKTEEDDPRNLNIVIAHEDGSTTTANFTIPICTVCKKVFSSTGAVAIHMRTHTGQKPFKCETCDRRFSQKSSLKRHERIHSGVFPFSCPVCQRRFNDQTNMKKHCKTHEKKAVSLQDMKTVDE